MAARESRKLGKLTPVENIALRLVFDALRDSERINRWLTRSNQDMSLAFRGARRATPSRYICAIASQTWSISSATAAKSFRRLTNILRGSRIISERRFIA